MKQFDSASINQRLLKTLSNLSGWTQVIADSGVTSTTNSFSEMEAEAVRYLEYLLIESKWSKAQNLSSLLAQTPYLGYLPHRKISSINTDGFVVSHDSRLQGAGVSNIFSLSDLSTKNISPYSGTSFKIPTGSIFASTGGIQFISTADVWYPYGSLYMPVPIIQGIKQSISVTVLGNPFEQITINDTDTNGITQVETASNVYSQQFFSIYVTPAGATNGVGYSQIEDIYLAGSTDAVFDMSVAPDFSSVSFRFGNGITGVQLTPGAVVTITYLQTSGSLGIVDQNFTITSIGFSPPIPLYCTNFTSALGGQEVETIESIRGSAPNAYITEGGSVVTIPEYIKAIEAIPYIYLVTVYSGTYFDPVTQQTQGAVLYSAIKRDGTAPDPVQLNLDVLNQLSEEISPLDYSAPVNPAFLHLKFNVQAKITSSSINIPALINEINTDLYGKYGTLSQNFAIPVVNTTPVQFQGLFDNSSLTSYVSNTYGLSNVSNQVEAVVDLLPSSFTPDPTLVNYYDASFSFDPSYVRLKGFGDGVLHALKINIYFNLSSCPTCQYNNNSFSRTLFVVQSPNTTSAYTVTFSFLAAPSPGTITVCGLSIPLLTADIVSTAAVASKINTYLTSLPLVSSVTSSTIVMNNPIPSGFPSAGLITFLHGATQLTFNYTSITGGNTFAGCSPAPNGTALSASDTIYFPYVISITNSNPGVLTIVPSSSSIAPPTVSMGSTGITMTSTPTVQWTVLQYPYISNITDYSFMQNFALKSGSAPAAIQPGDTTTPYIPFQLVFDYTSLNPTNLTSSSLGTGILKIPQYLPVGNQNYINFAANLGSVLNAGITIQVIAQPFSADIAPAARNNIIEMLPAPGASPGQSNLTPDITTQITYVV
jgi:hypothetical protein